MQRGPSQRKEGTTTVTSLYALLPTNAVSLFTNPLWEPTQLQIPISATDHIHCIYFPSSTLHRADHGGTIPVHANFQKARWL